MFFLLGDEVARICEIHIVSNRFDVNAKHFLPFSFSFQIIVTIKVSYKRCQSTLDITPISAKNLKDSWNLVNVL